MKKAIKSISSVVGATLFILGMCVCACETPTLEQQAINSVIGFGTMVFGAVLVWLGVE